MDNNYDHSSRRYGPKGYAQSGKIMLSAIIILFGVVIFMLSLHIYFRWYLHHSRHRHHHLRHRTRRLVFFVEPNSSASATTTHGGGLDSSVLASIPIFLFSSDTHPDSLECAVCLSEFEDNEPGRVLPKCKHSFHTECIDMWFHSHSTCPVCRSPVEPEKSVTLHETLSESVVSADVPVEPVPGSGAGLFMNLTVEVPRNESVDELRLSSPASQGIRSPGTRLLSLKRMLSMNKKSPTSVAGTSCSIGLVS